MKSETFALRNSERQNLIEGKLTLVHFYKLIMEFVKFVGWSF